VSGHNEYSWRPYEGHERRVWHSPTLARLTTLAANPTCHQICMLVRKKKRQNIYEYEQTYMTSLALLQPPICEPWNYVTTLREQKNFYDQSLYSKCLFPSLCNTSLSTVWVTYVKGGWQFWMLHSNIKVFMATCYGTTSVMLVKSSDQIQLHYKLQFSAPVQGWDHNNICIHNVGAVCKHLCKWASHTNIHTHTWFYEYEFYVHCINY
jgi:hypothetical protein